MQLLALGATDVVADTLNIIEVASMDETIQIYV